ACASLPGETPQPAMRAPSAFASERALTAAATAWPGAGWWQAYGDAQLDALIEEGLRGSPSVAMADARLARARSYQASARGALAPQAAAKLSFTEQKLSYNDLTPAAFTPQGWNDYGRASLEF